MFIILVEFFGGLILLMAIGWFIGYLLKLDQNLKYPGNENK